MMVNDMKGRSDDEERERERGGRESTSCRVWMQCGEREREEGGSPPRAGCGCGGGDNVSIGTSPSPQHAARTRVGAGVMGQ